MSEITLYDIASSNVGRAWSPNAWKARYTLNYKGLAYKTQWIEYPDIESVSIKIGASPTGKKSDGSPLYTVPFIYDPKTKRAISDSFAIAEYLDETYPDTPQVVPAHTRALQKAFIDTTFEVVVGPMMKIMIPVTHSILNPRSQEHFRRLPERVFGKTVEDINPTGDARLKEWEGIKAAWTKSDTWLQQGKDVGPWFGGKDILVVDFAVASRLIWVREAFGAESVEWQDIMTWDGGRWANYVNNLKNYETVA